MIVDGHVAGSTASVAANCRDISSGRAEVVVRGRRALAACEPSAPRILFLGVTYAGHRTRFQNLEAHTRDDPRIRATYKRVTGWKSGGRAERLPLLPAGLKGRLRATLEASAFAGIPRPDAVWCSAVEVAAPYLWAQLGPLRRPMVLDLDATLEQLDAMAPMYFGREPRRGARYRLARLQESAIWRSTTLFTPWSTWAADSLRRQGVPEDRIVVLPPGIDLESWRPRAAMAAEHEGPLKLLFVGGDFERKGGDLLLDVFRTRLTGRAELDIVTRSPVAESPGVRVHRAEPNSQQLRDLYARADVFVLPTRAECFGIATVEAMSAGLPVIVADIGGARDIVDPGDTGWLIEPRPDSLVAAIERALQDRRRLCQMGRRARRVAEARFDGRRNGAALVDLLTALASDHRRARQ